MNHQPPRSRATSHPFVMVALMLVPAVGQAAEPAQPAPAAPVAQATANPANATTAPLAALSPMVHRLRPTKAKGKATPAATPAPRASRVVRAKKLRAMHARYRHPVQAIELGTTTIEGRITKPAVTFFLSRARPPRLGLLGGDRYGLLKRLVTSARKARL